ncbi:MAG: hypothetical protein QOH28_500, partial [Actinomycetota bacterium]|nr:hypothetical protein [Actinomycetota bacterium]
DLHWADRSTLLLLLHLLKADAPASVLVVATYRDTDVDRAHPLARVLADLRRQRGVSRLTLAGLDGDGIASLLERAGGHDLDDPAREFAKTLWHDTDGNPFFVREVLLHLIETGDLVQTDGRWRPSATLDAAGLPEGVREVIGRRLAELPDATNTMLGAASVIGREFDTGMLAEIAGESADAVLEALEPAERARLIGDAPGRPGRYAFAHALVRAVLVDELGTNRRVRLHRAAGVALEAQPDPPLGELAYHFGEAAVMGETDRAVRYARAAAEQALDLAAPEEAVTFARRALDAARLDEVADSERPGLLLLLGRALDGSGALDEALNVVADAYARAVEIGDIDTACEAAIEFGSSNSFFLPDDERGAAQLRGALALLPSGDSLLRAAVLARYAQWLTGAPGDEGLRTAREAYDMAVRVDAPDVRQVAANAVAFMVTSIDPAAHLRFSEEALAIAVAGSGGARLEAYALVAQARLVFGDLDGADAAIAEMDVAFETSGLRALASYRASHRGTLDSWKIVRALIAGRFADAEAIVAAHDAMPSEDVLAHFGAANGRTQIAYLRGDWKGATAGWAEVRSLLPTTTQPYFGYLGTGGDIHDLRQYWQQWVAVDALRPAWTRPANTGVLAESLRRLEEPDAAAALYAEFADHSGYYFTNGIGWFYGPFDTALGILAATAGNLDSALVHLARAAEQCDAIASPTWGAIARLELATAARARDMSGDKEVASQAIAQAHRAMTDLGMPGWLERLELLDAGDLQPWRI